VDKYVEKLCVKKEYKTKGTDSCFVEKVITQKNLLTLGEKLCIFYTEKIEVYKQPWFSLNC